MGTFIWLVVTTLSGYFIGHHFFSTVPHIKLIGCSLGFLFGVITRLIVAVGGSGVDDAIDISFDLFD